jgi:aldehyde:ferredoxin oxidoreductase
MPYGWIGTDLEVDLSRGKIEKRPGDPKLVESFLGGKGICFKILWDRLTPEVDFFSPDNPLIFAVGILSGTIVPSANRTIVGFGSPMMEIPMYSSMGGFWGAELKHAGYDTLIISGKSPTPVYLWINNDKVEIRDAGHLWGKGISETHRIIREELKNDNVQIACIGLAGENKVYAASIEHNPAASCSRGSPGTVMGDKKLKAIAICGTKDINIANPPRLIELCEYINSRTDLVRDNWLNLYGKRYMAFLMRMIHYGNLAEMFPVDLREAIHNSGEMFQKFFDESTTRWVGCYNCGIRCKQTLPRPRGGYVTTKCHPIMSCMQTAKILNMQFAVDFMDLCFEYGLDGDSTAMCIAFAIDLYQKGILTKADTEGMHLEFGNSEIYLSMVQKIARREGIGDILANGAYKAARQIGKGAEKYAHTDKKQESIGVTGIPYQALVSAISDKGDMTRGESMPPIFVWNSPKEVREAYIKSDYFQYPKEFGKYFLMDYDSLGIEYEGICQLVAYDEEIYALANATGLCFFWVAFYYYPPISSRSMTADLISATTGLDIGEAEATGIANRIITLTRACTTRAGIRKEDDTVPEIFLSRPFRPQNLDPERDKWIIKYYEKSPMEPLDRERLNKWIGRYYEIRGWNREGVPTKDTLEKLGLGYVRQDLERRGILTS